MALANFITLNEYYTEVSNYRTNKKTGIATPVREFVKVSKPLAINTNLIRSIEPHKELPETNITLYKVSFSQDHFVLINEYAYANLLGLPVKESA